ncbi:unnamed protein product [Dicrocoelium dendriticum]|nr:unnamed protein product [Dicrocoelium dendriticum]
MKCSRRSHFTCCFRSYKTHSVRSVLLHLPEITRAHREALNETLESAAADVLADADEVHRRQLIAEDLMTALRARIPNLTISGIGSTWDGLTLPDSSVEINVDRADTAPESSMSDVLTEGQKLRTMASPFDSFAHTPGLGYLLAEVFDFLSSSAADSTIQADHTENNMPLCESPPDPLDAPSLQGDSNSRDSSSHRLLSEIHSVTHTNAESFCITFSDSQKVEYRITTGNRWGHCLSKLILNYFSLDQRARTLAIVFLKFCRMAYLDMPSRGTFPPPVLPLLIIFYLQHTSPPVLPNLHQMYLDHKADLPPDAYYQVIHNGLDLSFVTDSSFVSKTWTQTSDSQIGTELADLWLGLLRFYIFDFQKSKCAVNIVSPDPVPRRRGSGRTSSLSVMDPFDPNRDLCSLVTSNGCEYIHAQLLAAYAYFGVPRLDTGKHLFIRVRTRPPSPNRYFNYIDLNTDGCPITSCMDDQPTGPIRLTPVIDDADHFENNLTKVNSLFAAKFSHTVRELERVAKRAARDEGVIATPEPTRDLPIISMVPFILQFVLEEVLEPDDAADIVKRCMSKSLGCDKLPIETRLSSVQFQYLTAMFAKAFWSKICTLFINRGSLVARPRPFAKVTCLIFRACLLQYLNCQIATSSPAFSPVKACGSDLLHTTNDSISSQPADYEVAGDGHSDMAEFTDTPGGDVPYANDAQDICLDCDFCSSFSLEAHDTLSEPYHSLDHEHCEFAERTLDLGDEDDICLDSSNQPQTIAMHDTPLSGPTATDDVTIVAPQADIDGKIFEAAGPHTSVTKVPNEGAGISNRTHSPGTCNHTDSTAIVKPKTKKRKKQAQRGSPSKKEAASVKKRLTDTESKTMTWETAIISRDSFGKPIDYDRAGYYHSAAVNKLKKEDLWFPFIPSCHSNGQDVASTYILTPLESSEQSTMLAHHSPPQPQCRACGQLGHGQANCATAADKSVSFAVWKRLVSDLPAPASEAQQAALSETLLELSRFHDCAHQEEKKHFIVGVLRSIFSKKFPAVRLQLFGSCANGFELPSSDLDLCVFFPRDSPHFHQLMNDESVPQLIREFRSELYRSSRLLQIVHVRAILHAKVPILKVRFENGSEVDISFSNYLALVNTRMLKLYTVIDSRLRVLGIALKIIGKLCHIGNASVGGVSSYALVIMLIHYLQQKDQLPVLQQLYEGAIKPVHLVNGWDAWFQDDISLIRRLWTPPERRMSLGELWLGFFRYFLFEFDRDVNVVCIRQKKMLPRFLKMWDSLFAVEDPFNLDHNLTGSLRRDSLLCILDVFYAVLVHHTTTLPDNMPLGEWRYKLFSPSCLAAKQRRSPPPRSKCQRCHEFGHRATDCPTKDRKNSGIIAASADSYVDTLVGHFLTNNSKPPDALNTQPSDVNKNTDNVWFRGKGIPQSETHQPRPPSVTHVRFSNPPGSLYTPNVVPRARYSAFSNYAPRPRANIMHPPHPQLLPNRLCQPIMQSPRVPASLTVNYPPGSQSVNTISLVQLSNPQSTRTDQVNDRRSVVLSPRVVVWPEVRTQQQSPAVRTPGPLPTNGKEHCVNGWCNEQPSSASNSTCERTTTPHRRRNRRRKAVCKSTLPDDPNGLPIAESSHQQPNGQSASRLLNLSEHGNACQDTRKTNTVNQLVLSNSTDSSTVQKTHIKGCFTRSKAYPKTSNPPDVDLSTRFRNMSTHPDG